MDESQRREHFRIRYPESARPSLWIGVHRYELTELSERGLRFLVERNEPAEAAAAEPIDAEEAAWPDGFGRPGRRSRLAAILRLYSGAVRHVQGDLVRWESPEVIVSGLQGVTFADVLEEQRALLRDYPDCLRD